MLIYNQLMKKSVNLQSIYKNSVNLQSINEKGVNLQSVNENLVYTNHDIRVLILSLSAVIG